jgi:hypothetical protein
LPLQRRRRAETDLPADSGYATSRAQSMKSCVTGTLPAAADELDRRLGVHLIFALSWSH